MKFFQMCVLCVVVFLLSGLLSPDVSFAHGVEASEVTDGTGRSVRSVRFAYSTGEPMMYAKVKVYSPSSPNMEVLQGGTDRNGLFSFIPDEDGEWRIVADDGMGHMGTVTVSAAKEIADNVSAGSVYDGRPSRPLAIILGLSLIFNIFAGWSLFARRKSGGHAH